MVTNSDVVQDCALLLVDVDVVQDCVGVVINSDVVQDCAGVVVKAGTPLRPPVPSRYPSATGAGQRET